MTTKTQDKQKKEIIHLYRYESWDRDTSINNIQIQLDKLGEEGWEVVSHSHSIYGMSVILKKQKYTSPI